MFQTPNKIIRSAGLTWLLALLVAPVAQAATPEASFVQIRDVFQLDSPDKKAVERAGLIALIYRELIHCPVPFEPNRVALVWIPHEGPAEELPISEKDLGPVTRRGIGLKNGDHFHTSPVQGLTSAQPVLGSFPSLQVSGSEGEILTINGAEKFVRMLGRDDALMSTDTLRRRLLGSYPGYRGATPVSPPSVHTVFVAKDNPSLFVVAHRPRENEALNVGWNLALVETLPNDQVRVIAATSGTGARPEQTHFLDAPLKAMVGDQVDLVPLMSLSPPTYNQYLVRRNLLPGFGETNQVASLYKSDKYKVILVGMNHGSDDPVSFPTELVPVTDLIWAGKFVQSVRPELARFLLSFDPPRGSFFGMLEHMRCVKALSPSY